MFRTFLSAFALMVTLCVPEAVNAWNDAGHMTVARIAWDNISVDERASILAILRQHPHLDSLLRKDRPREATDEEWIFVRAAVWADYVRPPKSFPRDDISRHELYKFHRGSWHYVNFPYFANQTTSEFPQKPLRSDTDILQQLRQTMDIILNVENRDDGRVAGISDEQNRAVRMTWLFHLVGDLHQPLHAVALVDPQLFPDAPHTDQGGNKLAIRADSGSMPKNLHWLWDEMFATDSHFDQVRQHAERLTHDPALRHENLPELNQHLKFREWAAESYAGAIVHAYQSHRLKPVLWDDVSTNQIAVSDVPILHADEMQKARQFAQRRIAIAGYRLAAKLKEIARR